IPGRAPRHRAPSPLAHPRTHRADGGTRHHAQHRQRGLQQDRHRTQSTPFLGSAMSILVNKDTKVLVQGLTGKTGTFHTEQALAYYGTKMVGGVNPKKAGETWTSGVDG